MRVRSAVASLSVDHMSPDLAFEMSPKLPPRTQHYHINVLARLGGVERSG
jgi:hypothetical protein